MRLDELPIFPFLPRIKSALASGSLVLSAETGAGKTSAVPAYLVSSGTLPGKILVLQPRRIAAIASASRVSELLGTTLGSAVGYRVRGDSRASRSTLVEFVTEMVFIRMIQDDPLLSGVSVVVFDEFHERSAAGDLGLVFAKEAQEARGDFSILVMSATMDGERVADYLGCASLKVPGRTYPINTSYAPPSAGEAMEATVSRAVITALEDVDGDILVFLPGKRELGRVAETLGAMLTHSAIVVSKPVDIMTLHGSQSLQDQGIIMVPQQGASRRVILSTNVAETSLTVPRIGAVVDSGLSRFMRFHAPSGLNRLVSERVSAQEADQRRGRAGRLGPGACIRCWHESDILQASRGTELSRIELSSVVLECAVRAAPDMDSIDWLDAPPRYAWDSALRLLKAIGLIDQAGTISDDGKKASMLGTEPRAATALLRAGNDRSKLHATALAVASSSEREGSGSCSDGDIRTDLERLIAASGRNSPDGWRMNRVTLEANRLLERLTPGRSSGSTALAFDPVAARFAIPLVGDLLAAGFPDRLARRLDDGSWEFSSGRRARSAFAPPRTEWLIALDVDAGDPLGTIRRAAPVEPGCAKVALLAGAAGVTEVVWRGLAVSAWERNKAGAFTLSERRLDAVPIAMLTQAFATRLQTEGLSWLPWNDDSRALLERARFVASRGYPVGDWSEKTLIERLAKESTQWLSPSGAIIDERSLEALLAGLYAQEMRIIQAEAPAFITTPGGRRRRPIYPATGPARLVGRIQEFFGMTLGPVSCDTAITIELLSPADRPIQVTSDLSGFWQTTYPTVRKELSRRYPRHYWPEDPLVAEPTRGPKPRTIV